MSKLTLDALKERADAVATEDLMASITGGTANDCHPELSVFEQIWDNFVTIVTR